MQSSYRVIKNNYVKSGEEKVVETKFFKESGEEISEEINLNHHIEHLNYKEKYDEIVNEANELKQKIIEKSYVKAKEIEKSAYEKGYSEGKNNGYEDGYREAYDKNINEGLLKREEIINEANSILMRCHEDYEDYLKEKSNDIIDLSLTIAEKIVRKSLQAPEGLNEIIYDEIKNSRASKTFIIRCNELHVEEIKQKIVNWNETSGNQLKIFVVVDNSIEAGNAVIEKENGKIEVGIDAGMKKIQQSLY